MVSRNQQFWEEDIWLLRSVDAKNKDWDAMIYELKYVKIANWVPNIQKSSVKKPEKIKK